MAKKKGTRKSVYFGKISYKRKGDTANLGAILRVLPTTIELLELPEATAKQDETSLKGHLRTKSIQVQHPNGGKTKSGSPKTLSIPVPGPATIKQIRKFLEKTKAEYFRLEGRWYRVKSS